MKEKHDEASLLSFYNEIESSLRNTHFPNELTTDPNVTYNLLEKIILSAKEKHLKPAKTKLNHYKHKKNPWISMGIINSIKFRDKMYKRLRLTNCNSPMYETLMVPTPLGRPKIRTFPGPFQDLGQIYKDLQLTYDS